MKSTKNEILFFVLIFVIIILAGFISDNIYEKTKKMKSLIIISVSLMSSLLLYMIFKLGNVESFKLLEITPEKRCDGGKYLTGNNEYCNNQWSTEEGIKNLSKYNCINNGRQGLCHGRPLHFNRTPISNSNWENETTDYPILQDEHPSVL